MPFAAFGVFVLVMGIRSLVNGDIPRGEAIGMVAFGVVFAVVPLAVIGARVWRRNRRPFLDSWNLLTELHRDRSQLRKRGSIPLPTDPARIRTEGRSDPPLPGV